MGGGSRRSRRRDWWTSDRRRQPDRIHARPAVGMKLQMNHRERTNPRGPDRGTDRPTMPEGIRRVGRPAWQDGLGSDGEQHGTYMSIEQVMCILPEIVGGDCCGGERRSERLQLGELAPSRGPVS